MQERRQMSIRRLHMMGGVRVHNMHRRDGGRVAVSMEEGCRRDTKMGRGHSMLPPLFSFLLSATLSCSRAENQPSSCAAHRDEVSIKERPVLFSVQEICISICTCTCTCTCAVYIYTVYIYS